MAFFRTNDLSSSYDYTNVTKSDTDAIRVSGQVCRAIYIGGAGDVVAVMEGGNTATFTALNAGQIYPIGCIRVNSTGTTATGIVALF